MNRTSKTNKKFSILKKHRSVFITLAVVFGIIAFIVYLPTLIANAEYRVKPQLSFKKIDNPNTFQSNYIVKVNGGTQYYYRPESLEPYVMKFFEDTGVQVYLLDINLGAEGVTSDDVEAIIQQHITDPYGLYYTNACYDNEVRYGDLDEKYQGVQIYEKLYYGEELNKQLKADSRQTIINCWHRKENSVFDICFGDEAFIKSLNMSRDYLTHPFKIYFKRSIKWIILLGFVTYKVYKRKRQEYIEETKDILNTPLTSLQHEYTESLKNKYNKK